MFIFMKYRIIYCGDNNFLNNEDDDERLKIEIKN